MAAALCKGHPPKLRVEAEEALWASQRQLGISSILGSFPEKQTMPSLRRTFSADMSSKKWLPQTALKKVPSSKELSALPAEDGGHSSSYSSSEEENDHAERRKTDMERPGQFDIWSCIQASKEKDSNALALPSYVHPLVKKSSSTLSQKSLELCTESLGSETGSDGFSSDFEEERRERVETEAAGRMIKKLTFHSTVRSFPPPLPSISRPDGPRIHMRSHRCDGRLVLEAVPVQSQNYFRAERQGGRLLLTVARAPLRVLLNEEDNYNHEGEDVEEDEEEEVEEGGGTLLEDSPSEEQEEPLCRAAVRGQLMMEMKLPRILMINKVLDVIPFRNNPNPWAGEDKPGKGKTDVTVRVVAGPPRLLPSPVQAFNAYDYGWKRSTVLNSPPPNKLILTSTITTATYNNAQKKPFLLKANDFITVRCNESRKSPLILEPCCVAFT